MKEIRNLITNELTIKDNNLSELITYRWAGKNLGYRYAIDLLLKELNDLGNKITYMEYPREPFNHPETLRAERKNEALRIQCTQLRTAINLLSIVQIELNELNKELNKELED